MRYFPLTNSDREEMKKVIGINNIADLFSDLPKEKSYFPLDKIPHALEENQIIEKFKELGKKNTYNNYLSFLGGGSYDHFIPEVVDYLSSRGEFLTPYTPYQPEVSQGSLQAIFEYQTMCSMLTGLDVSNSSLYDGGTAAAEGILLAVRKTRKNRILVSDALHPEYREIIDTYIQNLGIEKVTVSYNKTTGMTDIDDLKSKIDENFAAIIYQSPNFFGVIEDCRGLSDLIHENGGLAVHSIAEAYSMPLLKSPGETGADIAVGEGQSLGLTLSYGGPYLGFMSVRKELVRQMPGRLVGQTLDSNGKRGYVLTLSTREQHIKREKATSNICSNQAWCALRSSIFMAVMGKTGLRKVSEENHKNMLYFKDLISGCDKYKIKFTGSCFNETVLDLKGLDTNIFMSRMKEKMIIPGIPMKWFFKNMQESVLISFTEKHTKEEIEHLAKTMREL